MKKFLVMGLLCISSCLSALAKTKHAPLPEQIKTAKTVFLDNESGMAIVLDYAYKELLKWKRYEVVDSPAKADLIFVFTAIDDRSVSTGMANGKPVTLVGGPCHATLIVYSAPNTTNALWQDTKRCSFHGASADLIRELKERLNEQP